MFFSLDSVCPDWTDLGLTFSINTAGMNLCSLHLGPKPKCASACAVTHSTTEFYQFITIFCLSLQNANGKRSNCAVASKQSIRHSPPCIA